MMSQFLQCIRRIGNQFTNKHFFVCINGMRDNIQQLSCFCLKFMSVYYIYNKQNYFLQKSHFTLADIPVSDELESVEKHALNCVMDGITILSWLRCTLTWWKALVRAAFRVAIAWRAAMRARKSDWRSMFQRIKLKCSTAIHRTIVYSTVQLKYDTIFLETKSSTRNVLQYKIISYIQNTFAIAKLVNFTLFQSQWSKYAKIILRWKVPMHKLTSNRNILKEQLVGI